MRHSLSKFNLRGVHLVSCGIFLLALASGSLAGSPPVEPGAPLISVEREPISPIPNAPPADPRKLALGALLFNDTRLSADNSRSCQSCHDLSTNGATGRRFDLALNGAPIHPSTPTVFNSGLNFRLDWEGDARTLEDQAEITIKDPRTMGLAIADAVHRLDADATMVQRFQDAYGHGPDRTSLLNAIAIYERSLVTPGSAFDRWLQGDQRALSAKELMGYALFKSLGCISCHQGVNVGGNLFERSGVFSRLTGANRKVFRVPSLRSIATTAPYFDDGSALTLDDAVRRMAIAQLDRPVTDGQTALIVAFLRTLTGRYQGHTIKAPSP